MKLLSLTMIPWLVRLWSQKILVEDSMEPLEGHIAQLEREFRGGVEPLIITKTVLTDSPSNPPSLLDLVKFRLPETMDAKSYQTMTAGKINSQRLYRSPRKLQSRPMQSVPTPRPTQEVSIIEDEREHEWLFGVKFESDDDDIQSWWMVIQDPARPSRMLVGCFNDGPPDKDGFLWAESKQEILIQSNLDEILGFSQTIMIGTKNEGGLELWISREKEEAVHAGVITLRGQGRSTVGRLRAIRQTFTEEPRTKPSSTTRPSESFHKRMVESLRRHLVLVTNPTPVRVRLEMEDDVCHVTLEDDEGAVIQDITIEYTADLISLLRWPIIKGGPIFTDSGTYVTWSIFDDIDYGELDFINPYVTYTAARKAPQELPKRVSQFFAEAESISVSIAHDSSICPLALGEGVDHEACWKIELPSECPVHVRKQLGRALTGEEINGLLAPGRIYAGGLYTFDLTLPTMSEKDESIVFHEERYIRMFLRNNGLPLKQLIPGTFLQVPDQQWMVFIEWDGRYFKWRAQSTISALFFRGDDQIIELVHGHGAQEECKRLLNIITSQIPPARIIEYSELEERVLTGLKNRGYSKSSPKCEFRFIEVTDSICRYGVFLVDGSQSVPFLSYPIEAGEMNVDSLLEGMVMELNEGKASAYNIRNVERFIERLSSWVNEHVQDMEWTSEEPVEYEVTLSIDDRKCAIIWEAEVYGTEESKSGVVYDDHKVLMNAGIRKAIREVREIFELDVVPILGIASNLDDVMKYQIPAMVKSIREGSK
jgi:hypothetical protein